MSKLHTSIQVGSARAASSHAASAASVWVPQFSNAAYGKKPTGRCNLCGNYIFSQFFRMNGLKVCDFCAEEARLGRSHAKSSWFLTALLTGLCGTFLGMIFYAVLSRSANTAGGFLSLGVGWIVGKTVMAGARDVGSFRLQMLAVGLTYAGVTLNALPALLLTAYSNPRLIAEWGPHLPAMILKGLVSPYMAFRADASGAGMELFLLLLGLFVAWQITRTKPFAIAGPFDVVAT
jgi:hypothetical protein